MFPNFLYQTWWYTSKGLFERLLVVHLYVLFNQVRMPDICHVRGEYMLPSMEQLCHLLIFFSVQQFNSL